MIRRMLLPLVFGALAPAVAIGQQANPSTAAFGMGDNYTALARNHEAIAWNMASLGLPGTKRVSLSLLGASTTIGSGPVPITGFIGGGTLSRETRNGWLRAVRANRTQWAEGMASLNLVSVNVGRLGLQLSGMMTSQVTLNGDAMEALLYGNAGATGQPRALSFTGSRGRAAGLVTAAAGYAIPLPTVAGGRHAFGVTGKWVQGAFMAMAQDIGTVITPSIITARFPMVHTGTDDLGNAGSGYGLDLSLVRQTRATTIAATVTNVVNRFAWNTEALVARNGRLVFDGSTNQVDFDRRPFAAAPAVFAWSLRNYIFMPTVSVGLARRMASTTMVTVDVRQQLGSENTILMGPPLHAGLGIDYRGLGFLPIRAGAAYETDGFAVSAGTELRVGPLGMGVSARYRNVTGMSRFGVMFSGIRVR